MPSKTQAQHNAMEAAAHGHSTLGIPKKVGEDFVAADKGKENPKESKVPAKALADALMRRMHGGK
jgi:hypothetical protein